MTERDRYRLDVLAVRDVAECIGERGEDAALEWCRAKDTPMHRAIADLLETARSGRPAYAGARAS